MIVCGVRPVNQEGWQDYRLPPAGQSLAARQESMVAHEVFHRIDMRQIKGGIKQKIINLADTMTKKKP